jgi:hypothetical protein
MPNTVMVESSPPRPASDGRQSLMIRLSAYGPLAKNSQRVSEPVSTGRSSSHVAAAVGAAAASPG